MNNRTPADRPFSHDGAPLQSVVQERHNGFAGIRNIRGDRLLTIGEHPQRRIRPGFTPQLDLTLRSNGFGSTDFTFDKDHPIQTFYWNGDNSFSLTDSGAKPAIDKVVGVPASLDNTVVYPTFGFDSMNSVETESNLSYSLHCKMELMDMEGNVVRTFEFGATLTRAVDRSAYTYNRTGTFNVANGAVVDQIRSVRLTWVATGDVDYAGGGASLAWFSPILLATTNKTVWPLYHWVDGVSTYRITIGNEDYSSQIFWANPSDHHQLFPWHYLPDISLFRALFYFNWVTRETSAPGCSVSPFATGKFVTVDANGADVDVLEIGGGGNIPLGLIETGAPNQLTKANGFYFKFERYFVTAISDGHPVYPDDTNILEFALPFNTYWFN